MNSLARDERSSHTAQTADRILSVAEAQFRHYGYSKTTVADIAKALDMSPANVYRFFSSKAELLEGVCARMLVQSEELARHHANLPLSAEERLRKYSLAQYHFTKSMMMTEQKVHEMVVVAIEQSWSVIEAHIDRLQGIMAEVIADGMAKGEFPEGDADMAARCFAAATSPLHHPQMVAQCIGKGNRAKPEELTEFALRALKA